MNPHSELTSKDVVIIGAFPAGMSALLWCADLGLDAAIVEQRPEPGGQLLAIHNPITNYLGLTAKNGREMRDRFVKHAGRSLTSQFIGTAASTIDVEKRIVYLSDYRAIRASAIILATGVRRRRLGIEGEIEFEGRGVIESGAKAKASLKNKRVVIVGGGDAALENAVILREYASEIRIIHRRGTFSARPEFVAAVAGDPGIRIEYGARPVRIVGSDLVEAVEFEHLAGGEAERIATDAVLIRIGVEPNSEIVRGYVATDDQGYVLAGRDGETNVTHVYAIGDVANPSAPTVSTATGSAASAVKAISTQLKTL
jgi:thioredoxin reductase (NADPH)